MQESMLYYVVNGVAGWKSVIGMKFAEGIKNNTWL